MVKLSKSLDGLKPTLLMILSQVLSSGLNILYKLIAADGMDLRIMVAYRFLFGAVFVIPLAFFIERKKRPKLTWKVIFQAFLAGLFGGALGQNLYLESLVLTSATFAAAMTNLIPAVTFVIAVCLRLEKLGWNTNAGKSKGFGTILGIGGAMVFTFYKGPEIILWKTNINLIDLVGHHHATEGQQKLHSHPNLVLGIILALLSCASYSSWLIIQAKAMASYPCPQSFSALLILMAAIQSTIYALCVQRDWSQWKMGWDIRLFTAAYAGFIISAIMFGLILICIRMKGPLFVSVFNPLMLVVTAIAGSLVLNEKLHLGSLLGAILIIGGLYAVLWGKNNEIKNDQLVVPEKTDGDQSQTREIEICIDPETENHENSNSKNEVID